jgi:hypothetical protein
MKTNWGERPKQLKPFIDEENNAYHEFKKHSAGSRPMFK